MKNAELQLVPNRQLLEYPQIKLQAQELVPAEQRTTMG